MTSMITEPSDIAEPSDAFLNHLNPMSGPDCVDQFLRAAKDQLVMELADQLAGALGCDAKLSPKLAVQLAGQA